MFSFMIFSFEPFLKNLQAAIDLCYHIFHDIWRGKGLADTLNTETVLTTCFQCGKQAESVVYVKLTYLYLFFIQSN